MLRAVIYYAVGDSSMSMSVPMFFLKLLLPPVAVFGMALGFKKWDHLQAGSEGGYRKQVRASGRLQWCLLTAVLAAFATLAFDVHSICAEAGSACDPDSLRDQSPHVAYMLIPATALVFLLVTGISALRKGGLVSVDAPVAPYTLLQSDV